jgi:rhamnosyl/mannosyltransferase
MRILHFYKTAFPDSMGGIEQVIDQVARGALRRGVQSEVLSLTPSRDTGTMEINGYLSHRAKLDLHVASTSFSWSVIARFAELSKQADLIHYHFPWPFMDVVHFMVRPGKPTVLTYHSDIIRQRYLAKVYDPIKNRFLREIDSIVATSPNYLETSEVLDLHRSKVVVIPIGLSRESYAEPTPDSLAQWRARFGERFFLFIGVIRYYKGLHVLLEAAAGSSYPIVIVGAGPIEDELKAQALELKLTNIHFLGYLPDADKVALLSLCYCVVFPSHLRSEAFGVSLLEGAMFGKPMISSEIGTGTTFINIANETGLVVPPSDAPALRAAMDRMWDDPSMALSMGLCARLRYQQYFTADQMVDSYVDLYRKVINARGKKSP